jgi:hypothetical protein
MQAAKAAFKQLVRAFGGQEAAAIETGVRQQKISDMGLPNVAEYPTLDLIDILEARTEGTADWPMVTRWLARRRGFALVRTISDAAEPESLRDGILTITRKLGDTADEVAEALHPASESGSCVSPGEARAIKAELHQMLEAGAGLMLLLDQIIADEGVKAQ